jgi:inositol phosphorylceramide mannosyltransferase catalytic subunit
MENKIPKKIHLVWLGGERPSKFDTLLDRIKKINVGFEIIEWHDQNINFELINHQLFNDTTNLGSKSDILRFELLYKFGGIYMDYDFLQIKSFDELLKYEFFAGTDKNNPNEVWNSIVGATQGNPICKKFLDGLYNNTPININETMRVMNETGPYYLTKLINENEWDCDLVILKGDYFFPFPGEKRNKVRNITQEDINYLESFKNENTFCIHLFTTTWQ